LLLSKNKKPAGWIEPLVGAVTWGHRAPARCLIEHGAACSWRACSNRPGRPLERTLDVCRFLIGLVENLGDVLPDRLARFRRNFLSKLPRLLVLGGRGLESLVRLRCGQGEDIRHRLAAQEMGEEIDRGGSIGVRDLDDLEPVVGRAPAITRVSRSASAISPDVALIFSQPSCARATPCSASLPNTSGNPMLGIPNNGIPKPFVPFSPAFTSL